MTPTQTAEAAILAAAPNHLLPYGRGEQLAAWLWDTHGARPSLAAVERERARRAGRPDPTQTTRPHRGRANRKAA